MSKTSAGILLYRRTNSGIEYLLVHPGGPYWKGKDMHAWSIPKGEMDDSEKLGEQTRPECIRNTARREFEEETGMPYQGPLIPLAPIKTSSRKVIHAFLAEGDFDTTTLRSNHFEMEWPPKSGKIQSFPEVDQAAWFDPTSARNKIHKGQIRILELAERVLADQKQLNFP